MEMSKNGIFVGINTIKVVCQANVNYFLQYLALLMILGYFKSNMSNILLRLKFSIYI